MSQSECPEVVDCRPRMAIRSVAGSAHGLKNHLTGILLCAERLATEIGHQDLATRRLINQIIGGGDRMLQSINDILDAANLDLLARSSRRVRCSISNLIRQVVRSNWDYALSKKTRLRCLDLCSWECWGHVEEEGMRMALDNLVNNAIKYSPRGSEVLVTLSSYEREGEVYASIRVKDHGPGLTQEDMARVFGQFHVLSARPTGRESSTGLGLSIVRQVVDGHRGRVWVESTHGQGATFCIDLPCRDVSLEPDPGVHP